MASCINMRLMALFRCIFWIFLACGCASTDSRIKKNQELFASFPADVQDLVRQGEVRIGFSPDMASIAIGQPRRKYRRITAEGEVEIWAYVQRKIQSETVPVRNRFSYRDSSGRYRLARDTEYITVDSYVEYDRLRLEFLGGKIVAIEQVTQ